MLSDSSYWLVSGAVYTYRKIASDVGWWSSPRSGKTTKYEYGLVLHIPDRPKNTCDEVLWALLDSGNIVVNRLPVRWSFPWAWCGCDRRTPVPSGLCSIQWKDLHKQQSYNSVRFILSIIPRTKGRYQFICLRQRKVMNKQLESSTNASNKSPVVFYFSTHCDPPAKTRIFFSKHQCCAEATQMWNRSSDVKKKKVTQTETGIHSTIILIPGGNYSFRIWDVSHVIMWFSH